MSRVSRSRQPDDALTAALGGDDRRQPEHHLSSLESPKAQRDKTDTGQIEVDRPSCSAYSLPLRRSRAHKAKRSSTHRLMLRTTMRCRSIR
jgi:hypothetical protein